MRESIPACQAYFSRSYRTAARHRIWQVSAVAVPWDAKSIGAASPPPPLRMMPRVRLLEMPRLGARLTAQGTFFRRASPDMRLALYFRHPTVPVGIPERMRVSLASLCHDLFFVCGFRT